MLRSPDHALRITHHVSRFNQAFSCHLDPDPLLSARVDFQYYEETHLIRFAPHRPYTEPAAGSAHLLQLRPGGGEGRRLPEYRIVHTRARARAQRLRGRGPGELQGTDLRRVERNAQFAG